jgi:hypothetical protein
MGVEAKKQKRREKKTIPPSQDFPYTQGQLSNHAAITADNIHSNST